MNDNVVTGDPVDGCCDLVLVSSLERVDNSQNLSRVAASRSGVGKDGSDGLLGVDDEDRADGKSNALLVDVGSVLVVKPKACVALSEFVSRPRVEHMTTYMS